MEKLDLDLGQVVRSAAGRDKGRYFLIAEILDDEFVKICDGDLRKINKGKVKKRRHLNKTNHVVLELKERLEMGYSVSDAEIRKFLKDFHEHC